MANEGEHGEGNHAHGKALEYNSPRANMWVQKFGTSWHVGTRELASTVMADVKVSF